ncbi:MAG: ferredoxin [Candidatus Sericytochromatia bacterium]
MANKKIKNQLNIKGKYYVDKNCIACDNCTGIANDFFKMNDLEGFAYVIKQPTSKVEENLCESARESCPVDAIGNDG